MSCGKKCYKTKTQALLVGIRRLKDRTCNTSYLRAYYCQWCQAWHLTKQQGGTNYERKSRKSGASFRFS